MVIDPSPLYLGRYAAAGKMGQDLNYRGDRHLLLFGPTGSGKSKRILISNLLRLRDRSLVVIDVKGELAEATASFRKTVGEIVLINPFNVGGMGSNGFNPLASLNPDSPTFVDDVVGLGEALIKTGEEKDPHWSNSARNLVTGLMAWEVVLARKEGRSPRLDNVRMMFTEAEEHAGGPGGEKPTKGLRYHAGRGCAEGGSDIESFLGRFKRGSDEMHSIVSTADRHTTWLLSRPVRDDLARDGVTFRDLKRRPVTVYVVLPAERLETHGTLLRLIIVSALRALLSRGGYPTVLMLDEFAQLGRLEPIETAFALVREFGVQVWAVLQDLNQMKSIYEKKWETLIGNAGVVQGFAPNDMTTAEWMSMRAGETTAVAKGFNQGGSVGQRGETNSDGVSYQQVKRRLFMPQDLMNLPAGSGLLWANGTSKTIPFKAPFYWEM